MYNKECKQGINRPHLYSKNTNEYLCNINSRIKYRPAILIYHLNGKHMGKSFLVVSFIIFLMKAGSAGAAEHYNNAVIGKPGIPEDVTRTIQIEIHDGSFSPSEINVSEGETIRFMVKNAGRMQHKMVIDTIKNLKKYAKAMRQDTHAIPDGTNQITLDPTEVKELVWQFTKTGIVDFACPLPGHFKGMRGKIIVENK